jgi:xylose isomerase
MMQKDKSLHSVCAWTFNPGKGGFVPADMRPQWDSSRLDTVGMIHIIRDEVAPRLPEHIQLGIEMHYDYELNEANAEAVGDALVDAGIYLAMTTPGTHRHWAYGGPASLDPDERRQANEFSRKVIDLTYGPLRKAWHPDPEKSPALVIWNGAWGYDIATIGIRRMYQNLKESMAKLCEYERAKGGKLFFALEPKPNEGHPAMLIPTVASAILFWRMLEEEFNITREQKGVNKEFGHTEMIGLDHVYDTVEELDNNMLVHMHMNSQGYNDGIILGGPGKFDIDHGVRINGMNIAIAGLIAEGRYNRWRGHDHQPRPYDNERQAVDRIVRSILSWDACEKAANELDVVTLMNHLAGRETAKAEDMMREAVVSAQIHFDEMYRG